MNSQERIETLLTTIDTLGMVTAEQLRSLHDMKSLRNSYFILKKLEPYTQSMFVNRRKVYYLNKEGRNFIASTKEVKKNQNVGHTLKRNDVYIYLNKPLDWENEKVFEFREHEKASKLDIVIKGLNISSKKRVVADASFTRNGYTYCVEIDNELDMSRNQRKIQSYVELFPHLKNPRLLIFTTTLNRKIKFEKWLFSLKLGGEVKTYSEIK